MANVNWMKISRISDFMILNIYYTYINVYVWYTKSVLIRTPLLFWGGSQGGKIKNFKWQNLDVYRDAIIPGLL